MRAVLIGRRFVEGRVEAPAIEVRGQRAPIIGWKSGILLERVPVRTRLVILALDFLNLVKLGASVEISHSLPSQSILGSERTC